jgi:hypothetical protein
MGEIYKRAARGVVVWLGTEGYDTHLVQNFLDRLIEGFKKKDLAEKAWSARFRTVDITKLGIPYLDDPGYGALYNLLLTPWSSRVWIVQEVAMAPRDPEIRVLRGRHSFSMEQVAMALSLIYKYRLEERLEYRYPARFATLWGERISRKDQPRLIDVVQRNWLTYAGDERDKIYGLTGLAGDISVTIDYNPQVTVVDVFMDFARNCISTYKNLAILGALSSGFEGRHPGLPSWVPDWTVWNEHTTLFISPELDAEGRGFMHFMASKEHSSSCQNPPTFSGEAQEHLKVKGCIIDSITEVGEVFRSSGTTDDILEFFRQSEYIANVQKEYTVLGSNEGNYGTAKVNIIAKKVYNPTEEPLLQAFYAALTMDDLAHSHLPRRFDKYNRTRRLCKTYFDFHTVSHMLRDSCLNPWIAPSPLLPNYNPILLGATMEHYVLEAMKLCVNRRLVRTCGKGYLGVFAERVQEGDKVVLLKGSRVPFVLRESCKKGDGTERLWEVIGDGYLHGVMGGDAWREDRCETFTLV